MAPRTPSPMVFSIPLINTRKYPAILINRAYGVS